MCEFERTFVELFGYILSTQEITMDTGKVKTIREWVVPTRVREVQSFLGFTKFYRCFIKGFPVIAQSLIAHFFVSKFLIFYAFSKLFMNQNCAQCIYFILELCQNSTYILF